MLFAPLPEVLSGTIASPLEQVGETHNSGEGDYAFIDATRHPTQVMILPGAHPAGSMAAMIPLDDDALDRVEALKRFLHARLGRQLEPDPRVTYQQRLRLRAMMQVSDGRLTGASYREIASVLYGPKRVVSEPWKTSALRDKVIGLAKGGLAMIGGGYLKLLRHRRRR